MALECDDCVKAARKLAWYSGGAGLALGAVAAWLVVKYVAR